MPYRPTPLMFKVDGKQCFNERPVSTQQTGFVFVSRCVHGCLERLAVFFGLVMMMPIW